MSGLETSELKLTPLEDGVSLHDMLEARIQEMRTDEKDAFYVVDLGDIVRKHLRWLGTLPRVRPFYAVKCNNTHTIVHTLATLGAGFDCASKAEIALVQSFGVDANRIIYANPCKQASHMRYAAEQGVDLMTFDNDAELHKVTRVNPNAKMVLRIVTDDSKSVCRFSMKFGASLKASRHLLETACNLGVDVVGVSFHVGSGCQDAQTYAQSIADARVLFNIAAEMGFNMNLLDIGGGFPGSDSSAKLTFDEIAAVVNPALDLYFPKGCGVNIIAEPGRYYVTSAFTLAVNVIAKKTFSKASANGGEEPVHMYYVNDGVYGSFNCILFDHVQPEPIVYKHIDPEEPMFESSLWGPTCDGLDRVVERMQLPELHVGDWFLFRNMGAYTMAAASNFNGFAKPPLHYVIRNADWIAIHELHRSLSEMRPCSNEEEVSVPLTCGLESGEPSFTPSSAAPGVNV